MEISRSSGAGWAEELEANGVETGDDIVDDALCSLMAGAEEIPLGWLANGPRVPMFSRAQYQWWKDMVDGRAPTPEEVRCVLAAMHSKQTSHIWARAWAQDWLCDGEVQLDPWVQYVFTFLGERRDMKGRELYSADELLRCFSFDRTLA